MPVKRKALFAICALGVIALVCVRFDQRPAQPFEETLDTWDWQSVDIPEDAGTGPVTLTPKKKRYAPADNIVVTCIWRNHSREKIGYGATFQLAKKVDGQWLIAQRSDGSVINFELWVRELLAGQSESYDYGPAIMLDEMTPGEYCILAEYLDSQKQNHPVYAFFEVA